MIKRIMPSSIRGKIMLCTGAITLLIAAVTVSICFVVFQSFLRRNQIQSAEYNLQVVSHNVSNDMDNIIYFNKWCTSSTDIIQYLEGFQNQVKMPSISSAKAPLRSMALNAYNRLKEEFFKTSSSQYIIRAIVSPENCMNYLQVNDRAAASIPRAASTVQDLPYFHELVTAGQYVWMGLEDCLYPASDSSLCIPMARPVKNQYNTETVGWTYLAVSDRIFLDYLKAFPLEPDSLLYITIGTHSYQYKDGLFTEASPDYTAVREINQDVLNNSTTVRLIRMADNTTRRMISRPLWDQGWSISLVLSEQDYNAQNQMYLLLIGTIVIIIGLMGLMLAYILNRTISQPVNQIRNKIRLISEGDFSRDPSIEWKDELGVIGRGINQMSENVVSLMERKVEDEKQKKDLEYRILQSQINPHFLYNTLETISSIAAVKQVFDICDICQKLGEIFRYNLGKNYGEFVTVAQELGHVQNYIFIIKKRYGNRFEVFYNISLDTDQVMTLRFILQPIIENAILHGLVKQTTTGTLELSVWEEENCLMIRVEDDGIGMDIQKVEELNRSINVADNLTKTGRNIGIRNVNQRIKLACGDKYGITVKSTLHYGSQFDIRLPLIRKGEKTDE